MNFPPMLRKFMHAIRSDAKIKTVEEQMEFDSGSEQNIQFTQADELEDIVEYIKRNRRDPTVKRKRIGMIFRVFLSLLSCPDAPLCSA